MRYSVIIPTRSRDYFLRYAIETVLCQNSQDFELIVSDNHSTDGTAGYLATIKDPRVRVVKPSVDLPMTKHYEFALSQARGEWVTIVGDDDGVMPYFFSAMDELTKKYPNVELISSERAYYFWPGCEDLYGPSVMSYRPHRKVQLRRLRKDLLLAFMGLRSVFELPQIYTTSVVRRSIVEKIKQDSHGQFYFSIIPDVYSSIAMALTADTYLRVGEPLFWVGTSNRSMSRSDRIYKDSTLTETPQQLRLNAQISQCLHAAGFGSMYLYEAYLQCPLNKRWLHRSLIGCLVYASLIRSIKTKHKFSIDISKSEISELIDVAIKDEKLPLLGVKLARAFISFLGIFTGIAQLHSRLLKKLDRIVFKTPQLISQDRNLFPDILKASEAVLRLQKKK